ncbi:MAG: hypothetical protein AAB288_15260 [Acidobacteriota bacterium]
MSIHLYNSLTKQKEELKVPDGKTIRMYTCGVTVYDQCHIGHARSLYIFDLIVRYLRFRDHCPPESLRKLGFAQVENLNLAV